MTLQSIYTTPNHPYPRQNLRFGVKDHFVGAKMAKNGQKVPLRVFQGITIRHQKLEQHFQGPPC